MYSVSEKKRILDYQKINFYNTIIENNYLLVKREGKWGVLDLDNLRLVVQCQYDYLGLVDKIKNDHLTSSEFIVGENGTYSIYTLGKDEFKKITNNFSSVIYDYSLTQLLLVLNLDNEYGIYDFIGNRFYSEYIIKDIVLTDSYIIFVDQEGILRVFAGLFNNPIVNEQIENFNRLTAKEKTGGLEIYLDGTLYKNIEI